MDARDKMLVDAIESRPESENERQLCEIIRKLERAPDDAECATESEQFYKSAMLRPLTPKQRVIYAYESGMRRECRT